MTLITLIFENNFYKFNEEFFKLQDGFQMGSPIAPLMAKIFMSHLESVIMLQLKLSKLLLVCIDMPKMFSVFRQGQRQIFTLFITKSMNFTTL